MKIKTKEELSKMSNLEVSKYSNELRIKRSQADGDVKKLLQKQIDFADSFREGFGKKEEGNNKNYLNDIKSGKTVKIPITDKSWVQISKHENGYYVRNIFNAGESTGKIHIEDTPEKAMKRANNILKREK